MYRTALKSFSEESFVASIFTPALMVNFPPFATTNFPVSLYVPSVRVTCCPFPISPLKSFLFTMKSVGFCSSGVLSSLEQETVVVANVRDNNARLNSLRSEEHTSELQSRPHLVC